MINTRMPLVTTAPGEDEIDYITVMKHELGHVLGIGHTSVVGSLMEPVYDGPRGIQLDDQLGAAALYPGAGLGSISGTVTEIDGATPIEGATVSLHIDAGNAASVSVETDANGEYTLPDLVSSGYVVSVAANGFEDQATGDGNGLGAVVDFSLIASEDGGGGGGGGPCGNPNSKNPFC